MVRRPPRSTRTDTPLPSTTRFRSREPEWLAERPEFDRLLERMREKRRIPEQRDFLSWRNERRQWFTTASEAIEETWALPEGSQLRVFAQPHPAGGLRSEEGRVGKECVRTCRSRRWSHN